MREAQKPEHLGRQRVNPGLGMKRVSLASPGEPREGREMQMHAGNENAIGADPVEHTFA